MSEPSAWIVNRGGHKVWVEDSAKEVEWQLAHGATAEPLYTREQLASEIEAEADIWHESPPKYDEGQALKFVAFWLRRPTPTETSHD